MHPTATILACIVTPGWVQILLDRVDNSVGEFYGLFSPPRARRRLPMAKIEDVTEQEENVDDQTTVTFSNQLEDSLIVNEGSSLPNESDDSSDHGFSMDLRMTPRRNGVDTAATERAFQEYLDQGNPALINVPVVEYSGGNSMHLTNSARMMSWKEMTLDQQDPRKFLQYMLERR